jgi:hypothetical protein
VQQRSINKQQIETFAWASFIVVAMIFSSKFKKPLTTKLKTG